MDYEKKYNEALEWMRDLYPGLHGATKEDAEHYFPELTESEDERIRKRLINLIRELAENKVPIMTGGYFVDGQDKKYIAWLEKQNNCLACDQHLKGYIAGRKATEEEKQKEQKPAQTSEEKEYIRTIKGVIADFIRDKQPEDAALYQKIYDWLDGRHIEQKPNIELIQRSWYMEGYHDREFNKEPKWIIKTGEGGPKHELNPKYGEYIKKEQKQPEVDLEKEIDNVIADYSFTKTIDSGGFKTTFLDYAKIARHFYELGLNARKEDEK